MALISKICVVLLGWIVVGIGLNYFTVLYYNMKAAMLDPNDKKMRRVYHDESWNEAFAQIEGHYDSEQDSALEAFAGLVAIGLVWPVTVAVEVSAFSNTYAKLKDEYDRGIRVRKEPS